MSRRLRRHGHQIDEAGRSENISRHPVEDMRHGGIFIGPAKNRLYLAVCMIFLTLSPKVIMVSDAQ